MARATGDKNLSLREQRLKQRMLAQKLAYKAEVAAVKARLVAARLRIKELTARV